MFQFLLIASIAAQGMSGSSARCTYHDYESYEPVASFENSPGWCGIRYSQLNLARITAVNGLGGDGCAKCLRVSGPAGSLYVLAVDTKADPGLDIARTSFAAITNTNVLNPISCSWTVVADSFCQGICTGTAAECTPGRRNLLPAPILVQQYGARPRAPQGLGSVQVSGGGGGNSGARAAETTTTANANRAAPTNDSSESRSESSNQDNSENGDSTRTTTTSVTVTSSSKHHHATSTHEDKKSSPTEYAASREEVIYGTVSSSRKSTPLMFMLFITMLF